MKSNGVKKKLGNLRLSSFWSLSLAALVASSFTTACGEDGTGSNPGAAGAAGGAGSAGGGGVGGADPVPTAPGIKLSAVSGDVGEDGSKATFAIVLESKPSAAVTIALTSSDASEGVVESASVTFTPENWSGEQIVSVVGVDDAESDGDQEFEIAFAVTSEDAKYAELKPAALKLKNLDDETAGFIVGEVSGPTSETNQGTATFTVVLKSKPSANVELSFDTSDAAEGVVSNPAGKKLIFTPENWKSAQTISVSGVDDAIKDGDKDYKIEFSAPQSTDANYASLTLEAVSLKNLDDETAGVLVELPQTLETSEQGGQAKFSVRLKSKPTENVELTLLVSKDEEAKLSAATLTFTPDNWNAPQEVTVTGKNDEVEDGDQSYSVGLTSASGDANYENLEIPPVALKNLDDEKPAFVVAISKDTTFERNDGELAEFSVKLRTQPTSDVTLTFKSDNKQEGLVNKGTSNTENGSLVFTAQNWSSPQSVKIKGVDDVIADGDRQYSVVFEAATSTDAKYAGKKPDQDVRLKNIDDENPGFIVTQATGKTSEEAASETSFKVRLSSQPTASVTLGFDSDNKAEGVVVSPSTKNCVFTTETWNTDCEIKLAGVDDSVKDGDQEYHVTFTGAESSDSKYQGKKPDAVRLINQDFGETVGVLAAVVDSTSDESGDKASFKVQLKSKPRNNVTLTFGSKNAGEGEPQTSSVTLTPQNWNAETIVTVNGKDDPIKDGDQPYEIEFLSISSADSEYQSSSLLPGNLAFTNLDNDEPKIRVEPVFTDENRLQTREGASPVGFKVKLDTQPRADVILKLKVSDATEAALSLEALTFDAHNWKDGIEVKVGGKPDSVQDGDQKYSIQFEPAESSDADYDDMTLDEVPALNVDVDQAGFEVSAVSGTTSEAEGRATFSIRLQSKPTHEVTLKFASSDSTEGTTDPQELKFTPDNWDAKQEVTILGVDDDAQDGTQKYFIVFTAAESDDPNYAGKSPNNLEVKNIDNDSGILIDGADLETSEAGDSAEFTVKLTVQPTHDVKLNVASNDVGEGSPQAPSITFTSENWETPQKVTIIGVNDEVADGEQPYKVSFAVETEDSQYQLSIPDKTLVNKDDSDTPKINVKVVDPQMSESGDTGTIELTLNSEPTSDVKLSFDGLGDEGQIVNNPKSVTFTKQNWNQPQSITVKGVDDSVVDLTQEYGVVFGPLTTDDAKYQVVALPETVKLQNVDNERASVNLDVRDAEASESGDLAQVCAVLGSKPSGDVILTFSSSNTAQGTITPAELTFTDANWTAQQCVTVNAVDDTDKDGNAEIWVDVVDVTSEDDNYDALYTAQKPLRANHSIAIEDND